MWLEHFSSLVQDLGEINELYKRVMSMFMDNKVLSKGLDRKFSKSWEYALREVSQILSTFKESLSFSKG